MCWSAPTVAENLAIDDAAARSAWATGLRRLRFWWGGPPAVVIGSSERPEQVVDARGLRQTGRGRTQTVHRRRQRAPDQRRAELLAHHACARELGPQGRLSSGHRADSRDALGLWGGWKPGKGRRTWRWVTGRSPGTRRPDGGKRSLVHGTLLVDFDYGLAESVLKHPPREPVYRRRRNHRDFMVTLRSLGLDADRAAIEGVALNAAREVFGEANGSGRESPPGDWRHDAGSAA